MRALLNFGTILNSSRYQIFSISVKTVRGTGKKNFVNVPVFFVLNYESIKAYAVFVISCLPAWRLVLWIRITVKTGSGSASKWKGANWSQGWPLTFKIEAWRLKILQSLGGSLGHWLQIRITLMRSRIQIRIKVESRIRIRSAWSWKEVSGSATLVKANQLQAYSWLIC